MVTQNTMSESLPNNSQQQQQHLQSLIPNVQTNLQLPNGSRRGKFVDFLEYSLPQLGDGNRLVALKLLELQQDNASTIFQLYKLSWIKLLLHKRFQRLNPQRKISSIAALVPITRRMTSNDNETLFKLDTLLLDWWRILAQVLISKGKVYRPFWTSQSKEISTHLWWPTKTGYAVSPSNSSNTLLPVQEEKYLSSIIRIPNPYPQTKNLPKTFSPSLPSSTADKWEEEGIKNIKIFFKPPTENTRNTLRKWFGTTRYVYNKGVAILREKPTSFYELRNQLVCHKPNKSNKNGKTEANSEIKDWELETPKVVREGGLNDLCKGYRECLKRVKDGTLSNFELHFKSKRDKRASIVINKEAPTLNENGIILFKKLLPETLKVGRRTRNKWFGKEQSLAKLWNNSSDIRLVTDGYKFWINFPVSVKNVKNTENDCTCALDPGLCCFHTCYSSKEVATCHERRWERVVELRKKLDGLRQARSKNRISRCVFSRRYHKWSSKLEGMSDNLHWETINYLTKNYSRIFLPHFESQEMRKNRLSRTVNRNFDYFRHYKFKCRLKDKCLEKGLDLYLVDESYTSLTCGICGRVKRKSELGGSRVYKCPLEKGGCGSVLDRDVNGARNILIKNLIKSRILLKLRPKEIVI